MKNFLIKFLKSLKASPKIRLDNGLVIAGIVVGHLLPLWGVIVLVAPFVALEIYLRFGVKN